MSHELDFTKGDAAIAYTGDTPWHGFGQRLNGDETLEEWIVQAGMDYSVIRRPVAFVNNRHINDEDEVVNDSIIGGITPPLITGISDKVALCRSDTADQLAIVSKNYKIVQPNEIM